MIGIRADGNEKIGTGHVMRCLSIGDAIRKKGGEAVYITVDAKEIIEEAGFRCIRIGGVFDDLSGEDLSPLLADMEIGTLLVDSYFADAAYFERLRGKARTAAVYDMGDTRLPVSMLINYNMDYDSHDYPDHMKLLLGCAYAPLRAEFSNLRLNRSFGEAGHVMLTTGGTDKYNITGQVIEMIREDGFFEDSVLHVVVGALNVFAGEIKKKAEKTPRIQLYENCRDMAALMQKCDVAISAGGSTLYEICACGLPCIPFSMADNQENVVDVMGKKGVMLPAGHYEKDPEGCLDAIRGNLKMLVRDAGLRERLSKKETGLVDGKGAGRIADELLKLDREK
jgi:UDP-2,4-diacetamido-2,4,6-trideoxy-beta-L-altropyranose hydrolase